MPRTLSAPRDRTYAIRYHEHAMTYTWAITTIPCISADNQYAAVETVLTAYWEASLHRYKATLHRSTTWVEDGFEYRTRNPHQVATLATLNAGRFGPQTLLRFARRTLASLSDEEAAWFDPAVVAIQPDLLAVA
jgi:hypothetical protein